MLPVRKERRRKKSIRKLVTIQLLLAATRHKKNLIF